jgi:hypothetical protein
MQPIKLKTPSSCKKKLGEHGKPLLKPEMNPT